LSDAVSAGTVLAPTMVPGGAATRELSEGARPGGNLATPLTRDALGVGAALATDAVLSPADAADAASAASRLKVNPFRQAWSGAKVAQPAAQQSIREGVQAATENAGTANESVAANIKNQPLLGRGQTVVDEHLASLRGMEQDAYDRMDEAAGFDVKALKDQVKNDEYSIQQLGTTADDMVKRTNLQTNINNAKTRIADAEVKMKAANIDPAEADGLHKSRMAGSDFRNALKNNTSSDGQTVNVNGLLQATKKLQFSKYGNRLEQFFGSPEAADSFMSNLEQAQKLGVKAAKAQQIAKWAGGILATAAGVSAGVGGIVHGVAALSE
jgi:hypothetical protein